MSEYKDAHGHTSAVDLTVSNHSELWDAFNEILDTVTPEPERAQTGHTADSLELAAAAYRRMVAELPSAKYGDLRGIDPNRVDWFGLIRDELAERESFARQFPGES